jgi:hypothetical protein
MFRTTVYFSPQEWDAIRKYAFEHECPYTEIVREVVRRMLRMGD